MKKYLYKLSKRLTVNKKIIPVAIFVIVAAFGFIYLGYTYATSNYASSEAESGTLTGSATIVNNSNTSNGEAVQFGSSTLASDLEPESTFFQSTNDLFNLDASSWPVDQNSANLVAGFVSAYTNNYGYVGTTGPPVFYASSSTPDVTINLQTTDCGGGGGSLNGATSIPIPSFVTAQWSNTQSSDNPLMIYQPSANGGQGQEWELWQARYNYTSNNPDFADAWSACYGGTITSMSTSNGILPDGGLSATRISYVATEITENDVNSGAINHAMAVDMPDCDGGVAPATDHDCSGSPCTTSTPAASCFPSEGTYLRFAPSVNCANYDQTKLENMVCIAGQKYGFVVTDFAGDVAVNVENEYDGYEAGLYGQGPTWGDNSNGQCCIITANGQDPLSLASIYLSGQYTGSQDENPVSGDPWPQLQAIVPPGVSLPTGY